MKEESLPPGDQNLMNDAPTGSSPAMEVQTDWAKLRQLTDAEIHNALVGDEEVHPTDETFWQAAKAAQQAVQRPKAAAWG